MLETLAALIRAATYAGALTGAGLVLANLTLCSGKVGERLARTAGGLLVFSSAASAALFTIRLDAGFDPAGLELALANPPGAALAMQALGGLWLAVNGLGRRAVIAVILVLMGFAVVGHAASSGALAAMLVTLHLAAASWWLGGLWVLLLSPTSDRIAYSALVQRFSGQALGIVALLLLAALATAALLLDGRPDFSRTYDAGLLGKLGLAIGLLTLAAGNRWWLTPRLSYANGPRALRAAILAEMALFACIIGLTAWLTANHGPHETAHEEPVQQVSGPIEVIDRWAPAMANPLGAGSAYLTIINHQPHADQLLRASSPWADRVTLHASRKSGGIARMEGLPSLPLASGERVTFAPGGYHLMFEGLYAPFVAGDTVPVTLEFARAGKIEITVEVRPIAAREGHEH